MEPIIIKASISKYNILSQLITFDDNGDIVFEYSETQNGGYYNAKINYYYHGIIILKVCTMDCQPYKYEFKYESAICNISSCK